MTPLLTIKQASIWASEYLQKNVTSSNISYLIQYGKVKKYVTNGNTSVNKNDLIDYYKRYNGYRESSWREKLGNDLNWALSFDWLKEKDTTKHIHRLHPYKGKFIPQLVEYFLDNHTDDFKKEVCFKKGDIVLDPFCGSGTTMVQANELGIHAVGIDISVFNALIANVKIGKVDFQDLENEIKHITNKLKDFISHHNNRLFEDELLTRLNIFNKQFFPSPDYKIKVSQKKIDEKVYSKEKEKAFIAIFDQLVKTYNLKIKQDCSNSFLEKWYLESYKKRDRLYFFTIKEY